MTADEERRSAKVELLNDSTTGRDDSARPPALGPPAAALGGPAAAGAELIDTSQGVDLRQRSELAPKLAWGSMSLAVVLGLYWLYTISPGANPVITPPPPAVLNALIDALANGSLLGHIGASLYRVLVGFGIGVVLAVVIGCTAGWFRTAGYILDPLIEAIRPIPALAYIPLVIVWVGIDEAARITIIWLAVFKPTVVNTRQGMKEIPRIYVEAAESLGTSRLATFWRVALPNAVPFIVSGMRIGLATGFLALVAAELIASSNGLGFLIANAGQNLRIDRVLMGIVVIGIVASLLDAIAVRVQAYLTRWSEVRR